MALGKGLNALLEDAGSEIKQQNEQVDQEALRFIEIPLKQIERNPFQPRVEFDDEALDELAASIELHGLIQPITVRRVGTHKYQLISGERRWRAAQKSGMERIPAYLRTADDQGSLEMALIENIQRENLNAMEVANSYQRLIEECSLRQEDLGKRVGKKRSTITNYLRLLKLPSELQIALRANLISMGHARAMLSVDDQDKQKKLLEDILEYDLSVRNVEKRVKEILDGVDEAPPANHKPEAKTNGQANNGGKTNYDKLLWEEKLSTYYNRKVVVKTKANGKGEIVVPFDNEEDLLVFANALLQK